ncbi:MAG: sugar phosphate isomerase/epimerase [Chitinophagaceae bacterium]|nr:sugar phosphate isomerase/epimerase [Chitinophagaceae bacterium]
MKLNRRDFIKKTSVVTTGALANQPVFSGGLHKKTTAYPVCVFTKCLQFLDYDNLAETIAAIGFDGADMPVRKGGHVLPENVKTDLPKAVKALQKSGIKVPMMVTDIIGPDHPEIEKILGTASALGIRHYRMGYLAYDPEKTVPENLDLHKRTMENLEKVNRKYDICGEYQNHSGTGVGAPVWDVYWILKDRDPAYLGAQYDIRHATCEGGSAWPIGMKLLAPWIKTTDIKDFIREKQNEKWQVKDVQLGEGQVDFDAYCKEYSRLGISGPVSIHYEYDLGGAEHGHTRPTMSLDKISSYLRNDLKWFRAKVEQYKM